MDRILTSVSAFRYHRIPPQVLSLYPTLPEAFEDPRHSRIAKSPLIEDLLGTPLHRLMPSDYKSTKSKLYLTHTVSRDLPFGSVVETEHGFQVASPALALLGLANTLSRAQLMMAAYELCGSYSAFAPCDRTEGLLASAIADGSLSSHDGWRRVVGSSGRPLNLWKREPLMDVEELAEFAGQAEGLHGVKRLRWAARHVTGICASPLEAQVSILLGLPKASGGLGLTFANNRRIALSAQAQALYPQLLLCGPLLRGQRLASAHRARVPGCLRPRRRGGIALRRRPHGCVAAHGRRGHPGHARANSRCRRLGGHKAAAYEASRSAHVKDSPPAEGRDRPAP